MTRSEAITWAGVVVLLVGVSQIYIIFVARKQGKADAERLIWASMIMTFTLGIVILLLPRPRG